MGKGSDITHLMPYPGRLILLGKDRTGDNNVAVYAITGRSPSSQARKLEEIDEQVRVVPVNTDVLNKGNPDLLIYPAIIIQNGIAVSNGKQTEDLAKHMKKHKNPVEILYDSLKYWDYEPDKPNFTPRISGCITHNDRAGLCIIKRAVNGENIKNYFEFPLIKGRGKVIATYKGRNKDPVPSFEGEPANFDVKGVTAEETACNVFDIMSPEKTKDDFRVAVACLYWNNKSGEHSIHIINRNERKMKSNGKNQ